MNLPKKKFTPKIFMYEYSRKLFTSLLRLKEFI